MLIVVAPVLGITFVLGTYAALRSPDLVDRVRVVNETPYLLDVEVRGGAGDGWLKLGPVSTGESHDFESVIDQGERWVFHVTTGPHDGGKFSMTRAGLQRVRWQVTIPRVIRSRLEAGSAVPHPRE